MDRSISRFERTLHGVAGIALLLFGSWLFVLAALVGLIPQRPNPYVPDGDPCCSIPDTWAESRAAAIAGWVWLWPAAVVLISGFWLLAGSASGRRLRKRWIPITVVAVMAASAAVSTIAYHRLEELPLMTHCRAEARHLQDIRAAPRAERERLAPIIAECRWLYGLTRSDVRALLGPPRSIRVESEYVELWRYGTRLLTVQFEPDPEARVGEGRGTVGHAWVATEDE